MDDHHHHGEPEPLTKEDALDMAFDFLAQGADHITDGRISEGTALNVLAQTAIALSDRLASGLLASGIVH